MLTPTHPSSGTVCCWRNFRNSIQYRYFKPRQYLESCEWGGRLIWTVVHYLYKSRSVVCLENGYNHCLRRCCAQNNEGQFVIWIFRYIAVINIMGITRRGIGEINVWVFFLFITGADINDHKESKGILVHFQESLVLNNVLRLEKRQKGWDQE